MIPCPKTPIPEDLIKLGVVQFARDTYPNLRFARLDFILSMSGYERYTMESLKRDYKEWKELRESPKKWQDLLEPLPAKFGIHDKQPRHDKFEIDYAKREFKEYKADLKKLPTLEKWAKAEIGKEFYQMILDHRNLYHLIRYGMMSNPNLRVIPAIPSGYTLIGDPSLPTSCNYCGSRVVYFMVRDVGGKDSKWVANVSDGKRHLCPQRPLVSESLKNEELLDEIETGLSRLLEVVRKARTAKRRLSEQQREISCSKSCVY